MKTTIRNLLIATLLLTLACEISRGQEAENSGKLLKEFYFAVEMNDILCGYSVGTITETFWEGHPSVEVKEDVSLKLKILGQGMNVSLNHLYYLNPETERYLFSEIKMSNGGVNLRYTTKVSGDSIWFTSTTRGEPKLILLDKETILESPLSYPHLMRDVVNGEQTEITYKVFDNRRGEVVEKRYSMLGADNINLAGEDYEVIKFEELNTSSGEKLTLWLDKADGGILKFQNPQRKIYLADPSVTKQIQMADADNIIFASVNKIIPDIHGITYMKVKAKIESTGEWIVAEDLSFPGQTFTGTVEENFIDGIFEIEPLRYDGANSPAFPYGYKLSESMLKYIEPEDLIESDHTSIIAEAKNITEGSENAWEAATQLSDWVANNIKGAIPGGGSAINTYNLREGECGSHSRLLAAFCRAVGIPSRLSIGCMYTTFYNGSFGQHAWTEVFMGDAGWIAVDATAFEIDFVDAGHIRLGEKASFYPKKMEIIEYRLGDGIANSVNIEIPERYESLIGCYTHLKNGKEFKILYQDGCLAVDIPDKMVLALDDPDENGLWYPKMTRQINFSFLNGQDGKVNKMKLQQLIPVPRKSELDQPSEDTPENLLAFTGIYFLPQASAEFKVYYVDEDLVLSDAFSKKEVILQPSDEFGKWTDGTTKREFFFEKGEEGEITSLVILDNLFLSKGIPISMVMSRIIENSGVDEGIKKYYELKASNEEEYIFGEEELNAVGYKLLSNNQTDEAVAVFALNVQEYPESWNVYDSLGEAYLKQRNKKFAKKNYKKSIKLNPDNENGKAMLKKVKTEL